MPNSGMPSRRPEDRGDYAPIMTAAANAVLSPVPTSATHRQAPPGVTAMVQTIRESFALVEPQAAEIAKYFYGMLFSIAPDTRALFPANMEIQRSRLLRALVHVVQMVDRPDDLIPFLRQLGRDHRKFGVVTAHYEAVGAALLAALEHYAGEAWTPEVQRAWSEAYGIMAKSMREAAAADEGPAYWNATVVEHHRINRELAVVRVSPDYPVPYQPGQYVSVEVEQRARLWRYFSPANAPRTDGIMEFHIRTVPNGWVSGSIVGHSKVGDTWRIGSPMGRLSVNRESGRDVLMIAGGTGVAPMRAIIDYLTQWGQNPRVHLFVGGRTLDDLYDLETLRAMSVGNPWLTVVPVTETESGIRGVEHGTLADAVTRYGAWADRDVLVCGSPAMIRATVSRMLIAGTPLDQIRYDPFSMD